MLFFFEFLPEKNHTDKKQIHTAPDHLIFLDDLPCFFHTGAPVYIIKNQNGIIVDMVEEEPKIIQRGL